MPKSHVHRTPSELQLADDMRRAEYEDVRMYARLVVGMQSQCMVSGYVHPLTKKSLQDILKTKQASQGTLNKLNHKNGLNSQPKLGVHEENHNEDWADLVEPTVAEAQDEASVDSPQPVQPMGMSAERPMMVKTPSERSMVSNLSNEEEDDDDEEDDDCVFSLEL